MAWTVDDKRKNVKARTSSAISDGFQKAIIEQAKLPRQERKSIVVNTIKIRNNTLRNSCAVLEGVVLRFDANGIAETLEINRPIIQREMDCRQGRFFFVEEDTPLVVEEAQPVIQETVDPVEQGLLAELNKEDTEEVEEEVEEEVISLPPEEEKTTKRGRPAKKAPLKKNK